MAFGVYKSDVVFSAETTKDIDVSTYINDARDSAPALYDSTGAIALLTIQAISASTFRITSGIPITGTYHFVVIGAGPVAAVAPVLDSPLVTAPTVSQLRTYGQLRAKIELDLDLQDETFITANEMIGYFNEGIEEAESEILKIDEDYFLTQTPLPLVAGRAEYDYPANIYGRKVRSMVYSNGSNIYDILRFRRKDKFNNIAYALQYGSADDYRWYHRDNQGGSPKIVLVPASRETAVVPPASNTSTPIILWYIRHANRVPLIAEYISNWDMIDQSTAVDPTTDKLTVSGTYVTGDKVKLTSTSAMPGGLTASTVYYAIAGSGFIKIATSLANATAGTAIDITSVGAGILSISIAGTQTIADNTIIDLPEFSKFVIQWAKCRCMEKEGDPRLGGAAETLTQQRLQMVSTLTEAQQDDQNQVDADFSAYTEMS